MARKLVNIPCVGGPLHGKKRSRYGFPGGGSYTFESCSAGDFWRYVDGGETMDRIYTAYLKTFMR